MDKKQTTRYSKDEIALMKQFIEAREDAPIVLRNHLLQLELSPKDKEFITTLPAETLRLFKKLFLPDLDGDLPLGAQASPYSKFNGTLEQLHYEIGYLQIAANDIVIDYFRQQYLALMTDKEPSIVLKDLPTEFRGNDQKELRVINLIAYADIIKLAEGRVNVLVQLTSQKEETPEEKLKRQKANSTK